jgi:replicative DNA helicase
VNGVLPPQATDLEEVVLGAMLLEVSDDIRQAQSILSPESFYDPKNRLIYAAIESLSKAQTPVDILTVTHALRKSGNLEFAGGALYISKLTNRVASSANILSHSRIIAQKHIQRELIKMCGDLSQDAYQDSTDALELIDRAELLIRALKESSMKGASTAKAMKAVMTEITDSITKRLEGVKPGVPTGLMELDKIIGGWNPTDMNIIAARPGMGKTALVLSSALHGAEKGIPCAIFSLEMSDVQLGGRLTAMRTEIEYRSLMIDTMDETRLRTYNESLGIMEQLPIFIDDTPGLSISELAARCRMMVRKHGVKVIYVDYLQKLKSDRRTGTRENEITEISGGLKNIAKELKVPVIALSQLSRKVEERANKRPLLSDLRESGAIEQDADSVIFIYRPEYYEETTDHAGNSLAGKAEIIVAKHRHGNIGDCWARFKKTVARFENLHSFVEPTTETLF